MYTQISKSLTTGHRMLPVTKKKGRQRSTRFYSLVPGDYSNGTWTTYMMKIEMAVSSTLMHYSACEQ